MGLLCVKLGRGTEFLDTDRGNCEFLACKLRKDVETVAPEHANPIREMCRRDVLIEDFADVGHELVHVVVRLVDIVEHVVALRDIVNHEFNESHNIAYIGHGFLVLPFPDHQELA